MIKMMKKNNTVIELFTEKTGIVKRVIYFRKLKDFTEFLKGFGEMRYPGYGWRYKDIRRSQENNK
jgi:hypothetical protein